jgi:hypothetical protein
MLTLAHKYHPEVGTKPDEVRFVRYACLAAVQAIALAQYQTPKLATVKVGGDRDNPLMVRDGVTSAELRAELIAMMMEAQETGEVLQLPAPIDGVANRDANRG